jgi:hypothetical protein
VHEAAAAEMHHDSRRAAHGALRFAYAPYVLALTIRARRVAAADEET